jgi:hypothetical protein
MDRRIPGLARLTASLAATTIFVATMQGCQRTESEGSPDAYVENGVVWAWGSVQLTAAEAPVVAMLSRKAGAQPLDGRASTTTYSLTGAMQARPDDGGTTRDFAYVDYHQSNDRLLAFAYELDATERAGQLGIVDVFAVLRKGGRSYWNRQRVYLGTATFQKDAKQARLALGDGLRVSQIADGVFAGQWALHYPQVRYIVVKPWAGMCPKGVTQMPGQTPGQTPGQWEHCRPLPAQQDLCGGDPTQADCRPRPPTQKPIPSGDEADQIRRRVVQSGLEVISEDDQVYVLSAEQKSAKLVFVSRTLAAADDKTNAQLCSRKFTAIGRTVDRQLNTSCVIKPAPTTPRDGRLACSVTVAFDQPQTYLERVCDVTASFRGAQDDEISVQVLRK